MKFLFKGAECSVNKGTAAIMKSAFMALKDAFENASFLSISPHPDLDKKNCSSITFLEGFYSKFRIFKIYRIKNDFDCLVDLSGDTISDDYGRLTALGLLYDIFIYKCVLRKPYVIYAQSLGPFNSIITRIAAKLSFRLVDLLIIREHITKSYLEDLGISKFVMGVDSAFILSAANKSRRDEILHGEKIPLNKAIIGINMSQHIYDLKNKADEYIDMHVRLINNLIENFDVNVLLIPHVIHEGFDDLDVSMMVYSRIKNDGVYILEGDYTSEELKSIIGQCDLFIGARMHATIASTSMFVPTVGIAYSHKMHGIIGEMLGLEDYIIDIEDLNSEILIEKTLKAWENREKIQEHLRKVIPEVKMKAWKNGELVKELCDSLGIS